jgi:hypothetical protein
VSITDINETVTPGANLTIAYKVENIGDVEDTQNITFTVNGTTEETQNVTLAGDENATQEFNYEVDANRADDLLVAVKSEDDSDSQVVTVETEQGGQDGQGAQSTEEPENGQEGQ